MCSIYINPDSWSLHAKLFLGGLIALFPEVEGNVLVFDHVLDFVAAEESGHEHKVEDEKWPEYWEIEVLEERQEGADQVRMDQFLPQHELLDLSLETLEFIRVSHRQDVIHFFEILFFRVHKGR